MNNSQQDDADKKQSAIQKRLKKMEILFDQEEHIVIDMGTGYIKAGFSGEDLPRVVIPTVVGERIIEIDEAQRNAMGGGDIKPKISHTFGNAGFKSRDTHQLHFPIQRGVITDFDHIEKLLEHVFRDELNLDLQKMHVLMTDSPTNPKENKMKISEIMFETFKVKSMALINTAVLSLFSNGKTSGLVAECGEGHSYAVPVYEGYALPHAMHTLDIAGQDITNKLIRELQATDIKVNENHFEFVRDIKENMCHVAWDFEQELMNKNDPLDREQRSYELPSGEIIEVNHHKRITAAEIMFNPSSAPEIQVVTNQAEESTQKGIASLAYQAIEKCDSDLRVNLYNNIVLAGGTTLMNGFADRFEGDLRQCAEMTAKTEINIEASLHRKYAAWIGGSMIASFSTFKDMTVTKTMYDETQPETEKSTVILKNTVY